MDSYLTCLICRKERKGILPIYCSCGNIIGTRPKQLSPRKLTHTELCLTNECGYCQGGSCRLFIDKNKQQGKIVAGRVSHLATRPWIKCPMEKDPMWFVGDVGFISVSYMQIGGTETFHRTLLPRLSNLAGFVVTSKDLATGDLSLLGCQYGVGIEAARRLARDVKVLVVWGIGDVLGTILDDLPQKPKVVSLSHCDDRSHWTVECMLKQEKWSDHFVYINKKGLGTVPLLRREDSTLIPNGIDEKRTRTTHTREEVRTKYGIPQEAKLGIMITRYSEEKGVREAMVAAHQAGHYFLVVGNASYWNGPYLKEIQSLQTDKVKLVGEVENPADVLIAADYYLSLSKYEGFGLSMAEAMAMGIQVISTPVGVVEDDPNLAHVIPLHAYTEDVVEAITNTTDTREYAKTTILQHYNSYRFVSHWQEFLNDMAGVQVPIRQHVSDSHPLSCRGYIG